MNKALCQAQKIDPLTSLKGFDPARRLWEAAIQSSVPLLDALDTCHECHALGPFTFNNGNTFAAIGRTLMEDCLKPVPPVEAQIIRTTVCHYIVGLIGRKELQQVLRHFEPMLDLQATKAAAVPESPRVAALPQEQRAPA